MATALPVHSGAAQRPGFELRGPAAGAVGDPLGWSASDSTALAEKRRRLLTAAVAYRGRQPLRVFSIEVSDLVAIADDRAGER